MAMAPSTDVLYSWHLKNKICRWSETGKGTRRRMTRRRRSRRRMRRTRMGVVEQKEEQMV